MSTRISSACCLLLLGSLTFSNSGCLNPQALHMLLKPFADNRIQPEYKLFDEQKEIKLAILSKFAAPAFDPKISPAETELPESLAIFFMKRCQENKHKLKIISQTLVRNDHG